MSRGTQQRVQDLLRSLPGNGLSAIQELVWVELGYARAGGRLSTQHWPDRARAVLAGEPTLIARYQSSAGSFEVIHASIGPAQDVHDALATAVFERLVTDHLLQEHPFALFIYSDPDGRTWRLVNVPLSTRTAHRHVLRRLTVCPAHQLGSLARRVTLLRLPAAAATQAGGDLLFTPQQVQEHHDRVFDVNAVADEFCREVGRVFEDLRTDFALQTGGASPADAIAHRFLVQIMFVSFLQSSGCLGYDLRLLYGLWRTYNQSNHLPDSFVGEWLEARLFAALRGSLRPSHACWQNLAPQLGAVLGSLPVLDGGLFARLGSEPDRDRLPRPTVTDERFEQILELLERHHFTAYEDTPFDQEMAVGPATLGQVYEHLLELSAEGGERSRAGVYYTRRVEANLMCRLALVDWLVNHVGERHQSLLNSAVFAIDAHERGQADASLAARDLWPRIRHLLGSATVMDPACGSGAFLIGMFQLLDDLLARANEQVGISQTSLERRASIVSGSLWGIEPKLLAVQIARLRLCLQLLADPGWRERASPSAGNASGRRLPDVKARLFCDDSLVPGGGAESSSRQAALEGRVGDTRRAFDIVIGNPPYIRQELIQSPNRRAGQAGAVGDSRYKARVARSVYAAWPKSFGYDTTRDRATKRLDARSDLYIYFYLLGLKLLDQLGTLCFISSNSWLDARYGTVLQEFLLTRGWLKLVIDNRNYRSFGCADVNTAIVLLGAAVDTEAPRPQNESRVVRFVVLDLPFERAIRASIWDEVGGKSGRSTSAEYRLLALEQGQLLRYGTSPVQKRFVGDKWGAKYLRAPGIYSVIQEAYGDKLLRLADIATVRRGITTGANGFFFLDGKAQARWGIESEYLLPAVKSPRECDRIWLDLQNMAGLRLFVCNRERSELQGKRALGYIEYGESRGFHLRPTCRRRSRWWDLGSRRGARVHCSYMVDELMRFCGAEMRFLTSDSFQEIHTTVEPEAIMAACNSTLCQLSANVLGRTNFGGGLLKMQTYELRELLVPDPRVLGEEVRGLIRGAGLLSLGEPGRRILDDIVFDAVGLTIGEREAVCEAVASLVAGRITKARSLS